MLRICLFFFVLACANGASAQEAATQEVSPQVEIASPSFEAPVIESPDLGSSTQTEPNARVENAPVESVIPAAENTPITAPPTDVTLKDQLSAAASKSQTFLQDGGPSIWAIAALSVITLALILWKIWRLALIGAWSRGKAQLAVKQFENRDIETALRTVDRRRGIRSKVVRAAIHSVQDFPEEVAREETTRVAKRELADAATGLRALELIATIAPLLGLLGTVLGMIAAFQALQDAGSRADPALLAGGIWEALLTTAAGMAVAIPASAALTWFEAVIDRIRRDVEDGVTRIFVHNQPVALKVAAE